MNQQHDTDPGGPESQLIYRLPPIEWHRTDEKPMCIQAYEGGVLYEFRHLEDDPLVILVTAAGHGETTDEQFGTIAAAMNWIDQKRIRHHEEITRKVRKKK